MWAVSAFIALGFLIGNLTGLTAQSVTSSILALLFAFGGGSAIAFVQQLDAARRKIASLAILSLSVSCLVGLYVGIVVSEHQMLSPDQTSTPQRASIESRKYLRENLVPKANAIDQQLQNKQLSLQQAYEELRALVTQPEPTR